MQQPIPRRGPGGSALAALTLDVESAREFILARAKPEHEWRVGIEYEAIGFERATVARIHRERVQTLLVMFCKAGGEPTLEQSDIIAVRMPYGDVTLEPGGQIEFSGFPERELDDNARSLDRFVADLHACASELSMFFVGLGFDPTCELESQSWINKRRYAIMRPYLRKRGVRAWDMMTRTAAAQTSIDYGDEEDLGRKYVLGNRAGPIVAAMFASSPFAGGVASGYKSTRYATWLQTDDDRTGPGPASLDERFDMRRYVAGVLDVPAFFLEREGVLKDVAGRRMRELEEADLDDLPSLLSMVFTEARVREYVEMRSADASTPEMALALAAFWKGLAYDSEALNEALSSIPRLSRAEFRALQAAVARDALAARVGTLDVLALAKDLVSLALFGLARVAPEELHYLDALAQNVLIDEVTPADVLLAESKSSGIERTIRAHAIA